MPVRFKISMSLDGFVAGPEQSTDNPLGSGERLFDDVGTDLHGLELDRTVATPQVTHLRFTRPRSGP
jgi:hypothetical protein